MSLCLFNVVLNRSITASELLIPKTNSVKKSISYWYKNFSSKKDILVIWNFPHDSSLLNGDPSGFPHYSTLSPVVDYKNITNSSSPCVHALAIWFCSISHQEMESFFILLAFLLDLTKRMQQRWCCTSSKPRPQKYFKCLLSFLELCQSTTRTSQG